MVRAWVQHQGTDLVLAIHMMDLEKTAENTNRNRAKDYASVGLLS